MRRFIIAGVVIFIIFISLILLFARRGDRPQQDVGVNRETSLVDYANTSSTVRFTQNGQINAREDHRVLQIIVGQNERTVVVFDGYQGNVLKSQTLLNDPDAYRAFLAALQNSGYTRPQIANRNVVPLGACPTGIRYNYDILNGADVKQSLWSTSCSKTRGTFAGNASQVRTLFQRQIPGYEDFIQNVDF